MEQPTEIALDRARAEVVNREIDGVIYYSATIHGATPVKKNGGVSMVGESRPASYTISFPSVLLDNSGVYDMGIQRLSLTLGPNPFFLIKSLDSTSTEDNSLVVSVMYTTNAGSTWTAVSNQLVLPQPSTFDDNNRTLSSKFLISQQQLLESLNAAIADLFTTTPVIAGVRPPVVSFNSSLNRFEIYVFANQSGGFVYPRGRFVGLNDINNYVLCFNYNLYRLVGLGFDGELLRVGTRDDYVGNRKFVGLTDTSHLDWRLVVHDEPNNLFKEGDAGYNPSALGQASTGESPYQYLKIQSNTHAHSFWDHYRFIAVQIEGPQMLPELATTNRSQVERHSSTAVMFQYLNLEPSHRNETIEFVAQGNNVRLQEIGGKNILRNMTIKLFYSNGYDMVDAELPPGAELVIEFIFIKKNRTITFPSISL